MRGARSLWAVLWCSMGALWLLPVNSSANATYQLIKAAPSGVRWLATVQASAADASKGQGLTISVVLAALSISVGLAVGLSWKPRSSFGSRSS